MKSTNWAEKYRPQTLDEVVGHPTAIETLREWAISWEDGIPQYRAIILYGRAGIGKCCKGNTLMLTDRGIIKIEDIVHVQTDFSNRYIDHGQTNFFDNLYIDDNNTNETLKEEDSNIKNIENVISISPKLNYDRYKITDRYDMGESDVITIRTRLGLEISGTPEHKIVIIDSNGKLRFKKLQDISTLDHIAISYNTNIFNKILGLNFFYRRKKGDNTSQTLANINYMNPEIAELLGYIIAEASDYDNMVSITNYDIEIVVRSLKICKDINIDANEHYEGGKLVGVVISSIAFKEFAYYLGYRKLAQNKEVPWSILQADKDSQISFIRALFDSDGTVGLGQYSDSPFIEYYSSSYELCRQLQIMLLNFGIIGRLSSKKGAINEYRGELREYEESYRLIILGGEILKFAEIINFGLSRKKEILNKCVEILENRDRWTDITYPNIEKIINRLYEELKVLGQKGKIVKKWQEDFTIGCNNIRLDRQKAISCKEYLKNNRLQHMYGYTVGKRRPSIYELRRILSVMKPIDYMSEYKYLEILPNRFIFDNIEIIKNEKVRVYDVRINDVHSYIGNSIINHNTTSAYALANDMVWEVLELNASDQRTAKMIEKSAGAGSKMDTISGSKRLIILDEADNIYGTADRGGEKAIIGLIKKTNHPIILIANELFEMSYGLRSSCKPIQFRPISYGTIVSILENIAKKEGVTYEKGVLEKIAENVDGDLRGAINDLQAAVQGMADKTKIGIKDIITGQRDTKEDIFKVLGKIFRGTDIIDAYRSTFNLDQNPEDFIQWIDQNLPQEYVKPVDLVNAYDYLSKASLFLGRVKRRQNYGMWKYASVLMTAGIVVSRSQTQKQFGFVKFQTPAIRKKLSETKGMRKIRDSLAKKIGSSCHTSIRFARHHLFPFFRFMMKDERYAISIAASLELDTEELAFLTKGNTKKIYDDAQSIIKEDAEYGIEVAGGFGRGKVEEKKEEKRDKLQSSLFDF